MNAGTRNRIIVFGLLWGLALAGFPVVFAFDGPFTLRPFLISAFGCSALAGAAGAFLAGRWASDRAGERPGTCAALSAGVLHGVVFSVLASLSIWVCLAVNISGFSAASGNILNLVGSPGIFEMSGVAAGAIFAYSLAVGLPLSPLSGILLLRAARTGDGKRMESPDSGIHGDGPPHRCDSIGGHGLSGGGIP